MRVEYNDLQRHLAAQIQDLFERFLPIASLALTQSEMLKMITEIGVSIVAFAVESGVASAKPGAEQMMADVLTSMAKSMLEKVPDNAISMAKAKREARR